MLNPAPWRVPATRSAADFLRERYGEVYAWCLQITGDDVHEAEDLIQDAFVLLSHATVSPEQLRNVEGYIYVLIRNLHRSRYERRRRHIPLPILDYDCARLGLAVVDSSHLLIVVDQLRRICQFACERKETSRAGSVLILRFFHGYYPSEIAAILLASRQSVEEYLRSIRKEARDFLAGTAKLALCDLKTASIHSSALALGCTPGSETTEALLNELQRLIFSSCSSPCPGAASLARQYHPEAISAAPLDLLAHIVSCHACLDEVNRLLKAPSLDTRNPTNSAGKQSGSGFTALPRRTPRKRSGSPANLRRLDHAAGEFFEHRPESLCVAVNGQPVATQPVASAHSEITVRLQQSTGIDFIEVFSEQDVRLLMIAIGELPPDGPFEQSAVTRLSEGRVLKATFRHTSPWPSVHVSYESDEFLSERGVADHLVPKPEVLVKRSWSWRPSFRWASVMLSLTAMFFYLVEQGTYNTAEARTLVEQCTVWENSAREAHPTVVRQRFELRERTSRQTSYEIVEVWRGSGRSHRLIRHLDKTGRLLGTSERIPSTSAVPPPDQIWQFEPSSETFLGFAQPQERLRVHKHAGNTEIEAERIKLVLDGSSHRPIGEVLRSGAREFEFVETSFDKVLATNSPIPVAPIEHAAPKRATLVATPSTASSEKPPLVPTLAELELAELQARVTLHSLGADLQDRARFRQLPDQVAVAILVDTHESRDKVLAALGRIPLIQPEFTVMTELAAEPRPAASQSSPGIADSAGVPQRRYEPLMEPYLKGQLRSTAAVNEVMAAAARASDDLLHRAVAISELAARYPATSIARLSPDARLELLRLVHSHLDELEIERRTFHAIALDLVRPVSPTQDDRHAAHTAGDWQGSCAALLQTTQAINHLSTSLFAQTTRAPEGDLSSVAATLLKLGERVLTEAEDIRRSLVAEASQ